MDGYEKLDVAMASARKLAEGYRAMADRSLPDTITEAMDRGWEMDLSGFEVEIPDWFFYGVGEREADNNRIGSCKRTLELWGAMEEEILSKLIRNRTALLMRRLRRYERMFKFIGEHGDEVVTAIRVAAENAYDALASINWSQDWGEILDQVGTALAVAAAAVAAAVLAGILSTIAAIVTDAVNAASPIAWLSVCTVVQGEKRQFHRAAKSNAFPQRPGVRLWRRKEARL